MQLKCCACARPLTHGFAIRVELSGKDVFVVQYLCRGCGQGLARTLVPHAERDAPVEHHQLVGVPV